MSDESIIELGTKNEELFILCEPTNFFYSDQSKTDNFYIQNLSNPLTREQCTNAAKEEFRSLLKTLQENDIAVKTFPQLSQDALASIYASDPTLCFKNEDFPMGVCVICPMRWPMRRLEHNQEMYKWIKEVCGYEQIIDLTYFENEDKALEGRGVTLFDWKARCIYAGKSQRAHPDVLQELAKRMTEISGKTYDFFIIEAWDNILNSIPFHTVAYMIILRDVVIIDWSSIKEFQHSEIKARLGQNYKIIEINYQEMYYGISGVTEFNNKKNGRTGLIISENSRKVMREELWIEINEIFNPVLVVNIDISEKVGGAAVECLFQPVPLPFIEGMCK